MRVLFVTQYYFPETGAPQNRLAGLAGELKKSGVDLEVLTAMPNYPKMEIHENYKGRFFFSEVIQNIQIYRTWIYVSKSRTIIARLLNYFSFVITSFIISFRIKGKFDFVLCESPPLFLGISAYFISRMKKARFIFNVSDLWPESAEKLNLIQNKLLLGLAYKLEAWLYKKSTLVSGQTQGICKDIVNRFPFVNTYWLPNGIDPGRFTENTLSGWRNEKGFQPSDFILLYAGIIGHAQGLEIIVNAAKRLKNMREIKFILLGDGPEKEKLEVLVRNLSLENIYFYPSINSMEMPEVVQACNAAIIPLKRLDLFKGAIPSKIFENLAMKKPILLGVEGEAKELFIDKGKCGLFFTPEDDKDLSDKIIQLFYNPELVDELGENGKQFVFDYFNREKIAADFYKELLKLN